MIHVENRKPSKKVTYEGSFAEELGIPREAWVDKSDKELHELVGYKGTEWRLKMQNEHIGNEMWDQSGFESSWSEFETDI
jgi:hypothetical protein